MSKEERDETDGGGCPVRMLDDAMGNEFLKEERDATVCNFLAPEIVGEKKHQGIQKGCQTQPERVRAR